MGRATAQKNRDSAMEQGSEVSKVKRGDWLAIALGCLGMIAPICPAEASPEVFDANPTVTLNQEQWPGETFSVFADPLVSPLENPENPVMAQLTSVSELSDVLPTDWAYQALRNLIERYNVNLSYADGTFRGDRPLSRYEFAELLSAVLDRVAVSLESGEQILQEDLETLQRLQIDYNDAVTALGRRMDRLGTTTDELEANHFSATTQMYGQLIVGLTDGNQGRSTVVMRQRLNLLTRLGTRSDRTTPPLLLTQLEMGNGGEDALSRTHDRDKNLFGTTGLLVDGGGLEYGGADDTLRLNRLSYTFYPSENLAITVGPKIAPSDFIDRNRWANDSAVDFSSSFFVNNPLIVQNQIDRRGGAGAAIAWNFPNTPLTFTALYAGANAESPQQGLFSDRYQGSAELEYLPNRRLALRLQYTNAKIDNSSINAVGFNGEVSFNRTLALFGRYGFAQYDGYNTAMDQTLDLSAHTWSIGVSARNFGIPGTLAGVAIGQPFLSAEVGDSTQTNVEGFVTLLLGDNISVTLDAMMVTHADNERDRDTVWQGTFRTVFNF